MTTPRTRGTPRSPHLKAVEETPETPAEVGGVPVRQLCCRGGHHEFALDKWIPGEPLPRGITVLPASEGRLKILEPCESCRAVTGVTYTHPGGVFDPYLPRQIHYGAEWVRLAMDVPRSRRVMRAARYSSKVAQAQIRELLAGVTTLEEPDDRPASGVAPAVFKGA